MRRLFLVTLAALVMLLPPGLSSPAARAGTPPDIIVLMVDDMGATDDRVLERLPNARQLFVENGLRFEKAYSETPLCCPGRAGFLSGHHTENHGVWINSGRLFDPSRTLATALDDAGYDTSLIGKYMNDTQFIKDRTPPGWDHADFLIDAKVDGDWTKSYWWRDGVDWYGDYKERELLNIAVERAQETPADTPLFMLLTPRSPHRNANLPGWNPRVEPRYEDDPRCAGITPWKPPSSTLAKGFALGSVCRSLLTADEMIGELRAVFAAQGRNPIWVWMSDNGMQWGIHGWRGKSLPWADRLPVWMAGPGVATGSTDALVSMIDFAPTLAELAGASMPWADGVSFASVLDGEGAGREWMYEVSDRLRRTPFWESIRQPDWRLLYWEGSYLLFDLRADPWERFSVNNRAKKRELKAILAGFHQAH
jgi:arylsulfatase A-like enzyme